MKIFISLFAVFLIFGINVNAAEKTVKELVNMIAEEGSLEMEYFFWVQSGNAYLAKTKPDGISFGVWYYTNNRKWQPIHNAGAFGSFPKAIKSFGSITKNNEKETISFSSIADGTISGITLEKAKILENKTIDIGWYFWKKGDDPFLFRKIDNNNIRIWYYTSKKKWRPIHNAGAFDGYPEAPKTLESASFNPALGTLSTGKSISATDENKSDDPSSEDNSFLKPDALSMNSSSIKDGEKLDEKYSSSISPALNWDIKPEVKSQNIVKSYAITLEDMDEKKYHWIVINIPKSIYSFPEGAPINYKGSKNIAHDFGTSSYKGPFPPAGETHTYKFTIFSFSTETITGKESLKTPLYQSSITVKYTGK